MKRTQANEIITQLQLQINQVIQQKNNITYGSNARQLNNKLSISCNKAKTTQRTESIVKLIGWQPESIVLEVIWQPNFVLKEDIWLADSIMGVVIWLADSIVGVVIRRPDSIKKLIDWRLKSIVLEVIGRSKVALKASKTGVDQL